ncbi:MAG: c-type cytochrome, partial [Anaerolineales bacterium]|nr:c-type cytochrome [Anaerolineales bacterium]
DVLSEPPGVPIVIAGNWEDSKLRARLRNNRMPPGWEFDIEETNRDGPLVNAGAAADASTESGDGANNGSSTLAISAPAAPPPPEIPDPIITESVEAPFTEPMFLAILGGLTILFGVVFAVVMVNRLRAKDRQPGGLLMTVDVSLLIFTLLATGTGGLALHAAITDQFTTTKTIHEEVPFVVEVDRTVPAVAEVRLEEWQASIPEAFSELENPFVNDVEAVTTGEKLYFDNNCYHCHGLELTGNGEFSPGLTPRPVNLTDPALMSLPFMTDNYLFWRISEGGANPPFLSAMPAWHTILSETERWQLVTFIRSQTSETVVDEGEQAAIAIIEQAGCFACHRSEALGRGGKIGPGWDPLSEVAGSRVPGMDAEAYVRDSIVNPREFVAPGFEDQAETMPPDFGERLSEEEIDILVEFLLHLGDEDGSH